MVTCICNEVPFVVFVLDLDKIRVSVSLMWYGVPQEMFATSANVYTVLQVYIIFFILTVLIIYDFDDKIWMNIR